MASSSELLTADITSLQAKAAQYRALAEEHARADNDLIAKKLLQVAIELEARAARLAVT